MHKGNKIYPVWSEQTEGLLWDKSHKILMIVHKFTLTNKSDKVNGMLFGVLFEERARSLVFGPNSEYSPRILVRNITRRV